MERINAATSLTHCCRGVNCGREDMSPDRGSHGFWFESHKIAMDLHLGSLPVFSSFQKVIEMSFTIQIHLSST